MNTFKYEPEWPALEEVKNKTNKAELTAIALVCWGHCYAGNKPPEYFGEMMAEIGEKLGISASPDSIAKYADEKGYLD